MQFDTPYFIKFATLSLARPPCVKALKVVLSDSLCTVYAQDVGQFSCILSRSELFETF